MPKNVTYGDREAGFGEAIADALVEKGAIGGEGGSSGTPITGEALETGGSSTIGWLSSIRKAFTTGLKLLDSAGAIAATIKAASIQSNLADTALIISSRDKNAVELTGTATAIDVNIIGSIDVSGYEAFSLHVFGTFSAGLQIQSSGDNFATQTEIVPFQRLTSFSPSVGSTIASAGIYKGDINFKHLRIRTTAFTSGTVNAVLLLYKNPRPSLGISGISSAITGNINISNNPGVVISVRAQQPPATGTINTSGDNTIISAPGAGQRIYITKLQIQLEASTTTTVLIKSGVTTIGRIRCVADGDGKIEPYSLGLERRLGVNEALVLNLSGNNAVGYEVEYYTGA